MSQRINYMQASPATMKAMMGLAAQVHRGSIEPMLQHLVCQRVSQINGCAFCLELHDRDLRAGGETPARLALLAGWREVDDVFTPRERAALDWAEALTQLGQHGVTDALYRRTHEEFGDQGLIDLTLTITTINMWNRMNIAFRIPPGSPKGQESK